MENKPPVDIYEVLGPYLDIESKKQKEIVVFYHKHCQDGFIAALTVQRFLSHHVLTFVPVQYKEYTVENVHQLDEYLELADLILVVDFSFRDDVFEKMTQRTIAPLVMLDHHDTVFKEQHYCADLPVMAKKYYHPHSAPLYMVLDKQRSGAMITWYILSQNQSAPLAIVYADDRDRWKFKYGGTRPFHAGLESRMTDWDPIDEKWQELFDFDSNLFNELINIGTVLEKAYWSDVEMILKFSFVIEFEGYTAGIVNATRKFRSDVAHTLALENDLGINWCVTDEGKAYVDLRRAPESKLPMNLLAERFGGGGHDKAAGFIIDLKEWVDYIHNHRI